MFQLRLRRMMVQVMTGCLVLLAAASAGADSFTIGITGGFLDMQPFAGPLVLSGDHGFTFSSGVDAVGGVFEPWEQCNAAPLCAPGFSLNLRGFWVGNDVVGDATLDGVMYPHVGGLNSPYSMTVEFAGMATLPPIADSATVVAPFTFSGAFDQLGGFSDPLEGLGTATLSLVRSGVPDRWSVTEARYDFAATPEPASLLLMTAGLAGAVLRFRSRQPRRRT